MRWRVLRGHRDGKSGELRIGCPEIPLKRLMPMIEAFRKTYPGIRIILDQGSNADMVKSVQIIEMNWRSSVQATNSRLKTKVIWTDEVVSFAHRERPFVGFRDLGTQLSEIPLILRREGSAVREVALEHLRKFKVTPLIAMESSSVNLLKEFVLRDKGIGFGREGCRE